MSGAATAEVEFNDDLEPEVQTDKERTKEVPCRECGRRLVVNVFYATANARCSVCKGGSGSGVASVGVPIPGQTDPAKAVRLEDCLVNPEFANAMCPVHPGDPEHEMELKHLSHHERFGPSEIIGWKGNRPEIRQLAVGEVAMHQCKKCKATVTLSTTAQTQFGRQNAPSTGKHNNGWVEVLGSMEEPS